jgi:hypothetical protein
VAESGSPEVVTEIARRVENIEAEHDGRTALWIAVYANKPDNARALVAAGADPWRPMMAGWSPGRLSLAGPYPDLFTVPPDGAARPDEPDAAVPPEAAVRPGELDTAVSPAEPDGAARPDRSGRARASIPPNEPGPYRLSEAEAAAAAEAPRLIAALDNSWYGDGDSLACVAGIDAAEAARRLAATPVDDIDVNEWLEDPPYDEADAAWIVGATDVPGGCVVYQPWGYAAEMPGVTKLLSHGTLCYAMYANPKSGNQGSITRDGVTIGWDLHPGGDVYASASSNEVLMAYLYQGRAVAYCCAFAGLRLTDARAVTGPPDVWLRLPERDYWTP